MTFDQALILHAGLNALDNKDGFDCDDPKTLYAIARNITKLDPLLKVVQKKQRSLQKEFFGELAQIPKDHPNVVRYQEKVQEFLESEIPPEIKLFSFTLADLKAKNNKVSGPTLAKLAPVLTDLDGVDKGPPLAEA